ncbi:hypothetical protein Pmar_PMAR018553 [Perkinsus marinus ATCC 50983]|uniref:Uncharacterized protein n=1 Tax=Perkinsus marinus (strain ATCC 50983 / TXsc) TaxID=423536 RepID=C5L051_PERM5|nr:hypothetical protein Pmar_PMAR018553 [Perkinsus marinus ATCC 50983]EER09909.1 hypothetical protein Pmar_PMAR018553 [Perkinsus marinus ATCC 50983]|eukprot:XP_002778114.1 hypothetical protein Pmar_PMAR018553 [Perkinsus marinus ATCC 50983]
MFFDSTDRTHTGFPTIERMVRNDMDNFDDFLLGEARVTLPIGQAMDHETVSFSPVRGHNRHAMSTGHVAGVSVGMMDYIGGQYAQDGKDMTGVRSSREVMAEPFPFTGEPLGAGGGALNVAGSPTSSFPAINMDLHGGYDYRLPSGIADGDKMVVPPFDAGLGGSIQMGYASRPGVAPGGGPFTSLPDMTDVTTPFVGHLSSQGTYRYPHQPSLSLNSASHSTAIPYKSSIKVIRRVNGYVTSLRAGRKQATGPYRSTLEECLLDRERIRRVQREGGLSNAQLLDVVEEMKCAAEGSGASRFGSRRNQKSDYTAPVGVRRMNKGFRASVRVDGREVYGPLRTDVEEAGKDRAEMLGLRHALDVPKMREFVKSLASRKARIDLTSGTSIAETGSARRKHSHVLPTRLGL